MKTLSLIFALLCCFSVAQANNQWYPQPPIPVVYNIVPPPVLVFQPPIVILPPLIYQPVVIPPPQVIVIDNRWVVRPYFPKY